MYLNSINILILFAILNCAIARHLVAIDERSVCKIKRSCAACLALSQCSWCVEKNVCFSESLPGFEDFCGNSAGDNSTGVIKYNDFELNIEENAKCACSTSNPDISGCLYPGYEDQPCFNRGQCVCGRCRCQPPEPQEHNTTKYVTGEYCELDNFSCDGPRCNEGPYSLIVHRGADGAELDATDY